MKPQYAFLILFALIITGLADGIEASFVGLGATPAAIPIIGTAAVTITEPLGLVIGLAVSWCINITLGAALVMMLLYNGMFYPQYLFPGLAAEAIPGINALPFWVLVVVLCIIKKTGEEAGGVVGKAAKVAIAAQSISSNPASVRGARQTMRAVQNIRTAAQPQQKAPEEQPARVGIDLKTINAKPQAI